MLAIPAIDILNGVCVRLHKGSYHEVTTYAPTPVETAQTFAAAGIPLLHIVDLDGARAGIGANDPAISEILAVPGIRIQVGGGIRTRERAVALLDAGVHRVIVGSAAIRRPMEVLSWVREVGEERMAIAVDMRDGNVSSDGWRVDHPQSAEGLLEFFADRGVRTFICTDIGRDGTMKGPNSEWYRQLKALFPSTAIIASGGVSSGDDLKMLNEAGLDGAIVGKAWYEGTVTIDELAIYADNAHHPLS